MTYPTVLERLSQHAASQPPDKKVWSFLSDRLEVTDSYSYSELDFATSHLAAHLLGSCGIRPGERVLLVFFPGLAFTASLLACFKAGIVGVPVFPPDPRKLQKDLHHFVSIQKSSGAAVVLTHTLYDYAKKVSGIKSIFSGGDTWPDLRWISVDDVLAKSRAKPLAADKQQLLNGARGGQDPQATAFLQYTSGSTSEPKGVVISHANLAHNLSIIVAELKADGDTRNVSWLPQYHDMGLIGSYLGALYCGGRGFYLSPLSFLKDPVLWLQALSSVRGTHTQAPSFAFALAARKVREAQREGRQLRLELSTVQHMINAAEPVDYPAIAEFYALLEPCGLRRGVVVPTYGLAEHTVFVCSGGRTVLSVDKVRLETARVAHVISCRSLDDPPAGAAATAAEQQLVGCGFFSRADGVQLLIVEEAGAEAGEGRVGEIWVKSPSRAGGYFGLKEKSDEDFGGCVAGEGGFLRTGDLGFLLSGELFVCGRIKDLIIVRGANHYPQDIERSAERAAAQWLRAGCSAAFAVAHGASGTEAVVYVAELKVDAKASDPALQATADACRAAVGSEHGLALFSVCLLRPRTVPKTTSGKIARGWCRRALEEGTLSIVKRVDYGVEEAAAVAAAGIGEGGEDAAGSGGGAEDAAAGLPSLSAEEVRALPPGEIAALLQRALALVAASSPAPLAQSPDPYSPLSSLGLDSLTIVQFKGVLERRFHVDVPDEFFFTQMASVASLADIVLAGGLSEQQQEALQSGVVEGEDGRRSAVVVQTQPLCPWFVLCC